MSTLLSARDEPELEQTRYDVVLLGTGLTNTILAGALSKAGASVLHVDARSEYGAHMASHNLAAFAEFVTAHAGPAPAETSASAAPSEAQLSQWRSQCKTLETEADTLSFEPIVARTPFFGGSFEDYSLEHARAQQELKEKQENEARAAAAAAAADAAAAASNPPSDAAAAPDAAAPEASATPVVPAATVVKSPVLSQSRRFSIDLSPHLLFSRSPLIDLLVTSGIHQYLEFKAVDHAYFATGTAKGAASSPASFPSGGAASSSAPPSLSLLPLSKSSIFQSSSLSMLEKRQLMKFLHLTLGDDYHAPTVGQAQEDRWRPQTQSSEVEVDTKVSVAPQQARHPALSEEQAAQPFSSFLALQKLSPQLTQMVLYAVALLDENAGAPAPSVAITAAEGMDRLRSYLASVGRYGPGAFLYPNYGLSELPQAFVRLSAVNRGVYILRFQPVAIVYSQQAGQGGAQKQYRGVLTAGGQLLTSSALVAESDYNSSAPSSELGTHELFYARVVLITDGPLAAAGSTSLAPSSFFSFAPATGAAEESPVYGLQFSSEVSAAPRGYCVVHLYAVSSTLEGSQRNTQRLKMLASQITQPLGGATESSSVNQPNLLAMGAYQQRVVRPIVAVTPWNGAANHTQEETEVVTAGATASSAAAAPATEAAAPDVVNVTAVTAAVDAAASSSDAPSSVASSVAAAAVPSPCRLVSQPLYSFAPSASVALSLDECLYDAQSLFARLCPGADFHRAMRTQPQDTHDEEMALLSQINQQQAADVGNDEDEHTAGEQTTTTTTTEESAVQQAPAEVAPVAVAVDADTPAVDSAAAPANSSPAS